MTNTEIAPQTIAAWTRVMETESAGLDLTDADHRAAFRLAMFDRTRGVHVALIRDLAKHFGATNVPTSGQGAAKALANAWIAR